MRTIDYTLLPPVGPTETPVRQSVADLLRDIPYLLIGGLIPPLVVANEILRSGLYDAGMSGGCQWDSFDVPQEEYDLIVQDLEAHGDGSGTPLRYEEPPSWVTGRRDWDLWVAEQVYSIPAGENRRLRDAMDEVEAAMRAAAERGDEDARIDHLCRLSELSSQWSDFVREHRRPRFDDTL